MKIEVAKFAKEVNKEIITIAGGVHATTLPERLMQDTNVDYTVLSEGEDRLFILLDILKKDDGDFSSMNGILYRENGIVKKKVNVGWYGMKKGTGSLNDIYPPDLSIYKNPEKMFNQQSKAAEECRQDVHQSDLFLHQEAALTNVVFVHLP